MGPWCCCCCCCSCFCSCCWSRWLDPVPGVTSPEPSGDKLRTNTGAEARSSANRLGAPRPLPPPPVAPASLAPPVLPTAKVADCVWRRRRERTPPPPPSPPEGAVLVDSQLRQLFCLHSSGYCDTLSTTCCSTPWVICCSTWGRWCSSVRRSRQRICTQGEGMGQGSIQGAGLGQQGWETGAGWWVGQDHPSLPIRWSSQEGRSRDKCCPEPAIGEGRMALMHHPSPTCAQGCGQGCGPSVARVRARVRTIQTRQVVRVR